MKKIMVATDFSKGAENAMEYACKFAADHNCEIVLFTLQNVSFHAQNSRFSSSSIITMLEQKSNSLRIIAEDLSKKHRIKVDTYFSSGYFYEELQHAIEKTSADILVMGMAKKSTEQDLMGNTTTAAIQKIKIPVLAIPQDVEYRGINHILFACDMVKSIHRLTLQAVRNFVKDLGASIEVFHVSEKVQELSEQTKDIDEVLCGTQYYYKNVESKKIIEEIEKEITETNADLLIMVKHKYGFWDSLVHRSKTRVMASGNKIPLLKLTIS